MKQTIKLIKDGDDFKLENKRLFSIDSALEVVGEGFSNNDVKVVYNAIHEGDEVATITVLNLLVNPTKKSVFSVKLVACGEAFIGKVFDNFAEVTALKNEVKELRNEITEIWTKLDVPTLN